MIFCFLCERKRFCPKNIPITDRFACCEAVKKEKDEPNGSSFSFLSLCPTQGVKSRASCDSFGSFLVGKKERDFSTFEDELTKIS